MFLRLYCVRYQYGGLHERSTTNNETERHTHTKKKNEGESIWFRLHPSFVARARSKLSSFTNDDRFTLAMSSSLEHPRETNTLIIGLCGSDQVFVLFQHDHHSLHKDFFRDEPIKLL